MISSNDFNAIAALDLEPIKMKLMHKPSGEGWSAEKANAVEIEYRRFLYLIKTFPADQTTPLVDVDTFWHYHILDTMKYALDCEQVFGYFLHHNQYVGMLGEASEQEWHEAGNRMQELYEQSFGVSYDQAARTIAQAGSKPANDAAAGPDSALSAAYCSTVSKQAAYCSAVDKQAAYCSTFSKQAAYCSAVGKQAAYCSAVSKQAAYCSAVGKQAAYCSAVGKQAAYCSAVSKQAAYCSAVTKQAAYCSAVTAGISDRFPHQVMKNQVAVVH